MRPTMQLLGMQLLLLLLVLLSWSAAQNPLEQMALGAMNVAGNIAQTIQSGAAIGQETGFQTSLVSVRSKTAMGFGDAIRERNGENSSEESDERRRKRSVHELLHRMKREPCMWKTMGANPPTDPSEDYGDVEARKRRRAAMKRSAAKTLKLKKKKKKLLRRRRQAEQLANAGEQMEQQARGIGERIKGMWFAFVDSVADVVQQVQQKVKDATQQAVASN